MSERKICEKIEELEGKFYFEPLDPQPCCANCKFYDACPLWIVAYEFVDGKFYCSDWELKE